MAKQKRGAFQRLKLYEKLIEPLQGKVEHVAILLKSPLHPPSPFASVRFSIDQMIHARVKTWSLTTNPRAVNQNTQKTSQCLLLPASYLHNQRVCVCVH